MSAGRILILTPNASPVVELAEVKLFCRVDTDADNTTLTNMERAAVQKCEALLRRPILVQTAQMWFDGGVGGTISTPFGKLVSVVSVKSYDQASVATTIDPSGYLVDLVGEMGGRIEFLVPVTSTRTMNTVCVEFTNGYANAAAVPQLLKEAIKSLVAFWYENRESYTSGEVPSNVKMKLSPYRILRM